MPDASIAPKLRNLTGSGAFDSIIAPVTREEFFSEYYEKKGLTVSRNDPDFFSSVLTLDRLDEYITTASPHYPQIGVIDARRDVPASEFTVNGDRIDVARLYQLFADGSSMVFPALHYKIPELQALCRAVEQVFDAPFQTNIYLSPPNAQGFRIHYDTHDVFVLQVAGTKDWNVYDTPLDLPLVGQKFRGAEYTEIPPVEQFRLYPGDLYYCPRGVVHDARSTDQISLHITFGLMAQTWTEFAVEAVSAACLTDPAFRENLPIGYTKTDFDRTAAKEKFRDLMLKIPDLVDFDALMDRFSESFVNDRRPLLRGQMQQVLDADKITADTLIQARPNLIYTLQRGDSGLVLRHFKADLTLPAHVEPTLTAMLNAETPSKLSDMPGSLDGAGRVVLAKKLLREGLITVAEAEA